MRYIPMILLWVLADIALCVVMMGLVGLVMVIANTADEGLGPDGVGGWLHRTAQSDAPRAAGYRAGQASVIGIKRYWLHLPD